MNFIPWIILIYFAVGIGMVIWNFRSSNTLHEPPKFLHDRSISTAVVFVLLWPYKILRKLS